MKSKRQPKGLADNSSLRTSKAVVQLEQAKALLRQQLRSGELEDYLVGQKREALKESDVLRLTTLHPNFLNGHKHKHTTKSEVGTFLKTLNAELAERRKLESNENSGATDWKAMYHKAIDRQERILTRAHAWKITMLRMARENRELKKKLGLKVVSLRP
ncbi:hypothetical protein MRS76_17920 [Rhizobiaceae bacterium n13]|uniref:Uncharacterized protein n=1 Tax=Ferirhizobium litorale TaxID=2927786 RepID=A0AAE3QDZ0_9HYPH|nr:hypothetical protein [Fererhizobium litorale]MDI7863833.1 hypothetical protein [Fererhizobium litorale]MDI7924067.1 hypothetical protein [Fererhizobium litorale]